MLSHLPLHVHVPVNPCKHVPVPANCPKGIRGYIKVKWQMHQSGKQRERQRLAWEICPQQVGCGATERAKGSTECLADCRTEAQESWGQRATAGVSGQTDGRRRIMVQACTQSGRRGHLVQCDPGNKHPDFAMIRQDHQRKGDFLRVSSHLPQMKMIGQF